MKNKLSMRRTQRNTKFKPPMLAVKENESIKVNSDTQDCLEEDNSIFHQIEIPSTPKPSVLLGLSTSDFESPMSSTKKPNPDLSLNDALSESSLNIFDLQDSPLVCGQRLENSESPFINKNNKRSLEESSPGVQIASPVFSKPKRRLNRTPIQEKSLLKRTLIASPKIASMNKTEKIIETPFKDIIIPNISTDFIAFDPDQNDVASPQTQKIITRIKSTFDEGTQIHYSQKTGAHYVQKQRTMVEKNEENIIDDDVSICQNSQIYTTQFRRDLERVFDDCEKSILDSKDNELKHETSKCENNVPSKEDIVNEAVKGISRIDWDDDDFDVKSQEIVSKYTVKTQSSHGRNKLAPISSSTFNELGPFFGLPLKVKHLIKEFKGIDELYDWQKECLQLKSVLQRNNLIYALPTSGGKTLVTEILMLREVICRRKNVLFILPYVSIVQEKVMALSPFAVHFDFLVEEYAAGKGTCPPRKRRTKHSIFIATIEKGLALLDSLISENRSDEIGLIVVDELHLLGEVGRGGTLEILLTKAMLINSNIQIVGMSATIGNINEVAEFLNSDVYTRDFRPVELKEYVKLGNEIVGINPLASDIDEAFIPSRTVDYGYSNEAKKLDPDYITGLVQETIPGESCLIFCPTKQNCENVALLLCKILSPDLKLHRGDEKRELMLAIERDVGTLCPVLSQTIPYGIAYHHSGLTSDERKHLEDSYRMGILCVICCTSTLAAGVNLPAKRVILRSPYVGRSFLTLSKYKQMSGRAGRSGQTDSGESILICTLKDLERVKELLFSPMDEAKSSLAIEETFGLQSFILSSIELGLANNRDDLQKIVKRTLLFLQSKRLQVNVKENVDKILAQLYKTNAVKLKAEASHSYLLQRNESVVIETTQNPLDEQKMQQIPGKPARFIKGKAPLEVSIQGKAAIKACITLEKANILYADLKKAAKHLVLMNYLHLLYLATPYDTADQNRPDPSAYYEAYNKLNNDERETARVIGLTEAKARHILQRKQFDPETLRILNRFFITLVLYDLWNGKSVHQTHLKYKIGRGTVQSLMQNAATQASSIMRFCEEIEEFWHFKQLFETLSKRIGYCCTAELLPLMELPSVKVARAKQMYNAGYKTLEQLASAVPADLVQNIEHMGFKVAKQLISAAKAILLERVENLRGEMQEVMDNLKQK
uniref:CSON004458 protein n=1 Tax=Culicoides sonorensis TaxID=179676 RepID=A0A336LTU1_CULSO